MRKKFFEIEANFDLRIKEKRPYVGMTDLEIDEWLNRATQRLNNHKQELIKLYQCELYIQQQDSFKGI